MASGGAKLHVFTARLPIEEYETLRHVSALLGLSVNETVRQAILSYLKREIGDERFEAMVVEAGDRFRRTVQRLGDA